MKKADRLALEQRTIYCVAKAFGNTGHTYEVRKMFGGDQQSLILVTVKQQVGEEIILWCDCPGFRMQKYAHIEHKHIKLVIDFQDRVEHEPDIEWAEYRIFGTGQKASIEWWNDNVTEECNNE